MSQQNYTIHALNFGGLMPRCKEQEHLIPNELLQQISASIEQRTGFKIEVAEKSLQPTPEDEDFSFGDILNLPPTETFDGMAIYYC